MTKGWTKKIEKIYKKDVKMFTNTVKKNEIDFIKNEDLGC
jgi:hypothetical protein